MPDAVGDLPTGVLPEVPLLAAPTVAEIAAQLRATAVVAPPAPREAPRVVVGAMGLPAFLERIVDGDLVESGDDRILCATEQLLLRGVADITLLGREDQVRARAATLGVDVSAARVDDVVDANAEMREAR